MVSKSSGSSEQGLGLTKRVIVQYNDSRDGETGIVHRMVSCTIPLDSGNQLQVFYNRTTHLFVVELLDKGGKGGNELVKWILNEESLLQHLRDSSSNSGGEN